MIVLGHVAQAIAAAALGAAAGFVALIGFVLALHVGVTVWQGLGSLWP